MNYNLILSTGTPSISGSLSNRLYRNASGLFSNNSFFYDQDVITGRHCSLISLNSQTLLEEIPIHVDGKNVSYDYILTGDYFLTPNDLNYSSLFRPADNLTLSNNDNLIYDKRRLYTGLFAYKTTIGSYEWTTAVEDFESELYGRGEITTADEIWTGWDIFFNGQKIDDKISSVLDATTGKLFLIKKKENILESTGVNPYVYGVSFIENQVDYYINGMEQNTSSFLELYTGVTVIEKSVSSYVTIINEQEQLYDL